MLYLIKGRAGSGKTKYMREIICNTINGEQGKPLLIIPEQFSFDTERAMLRILGPKKMKQIDVFSFTRLAFSFLKNTEYITKNFPDDGVRAALMSEALKQLEGRLTVFNSCKSTAAAMQPLVDFCKELKNCCIDSDELKEKTELLEESYLKEKLEDINLINEAYDALVSQSYFDDTDLVRILSSVSAEKGFFKHRTVFIDGFRAFSKQEFECLSVILAQADNVYITLCTDNLNSRFSPFYFIKEFERQIRATAAKNNIEVDEIICEQAENAFGSDIFQLEKNLFCDKKTESKLSDGSVRIVECTDSDEECRYVALAIKKMLRSGEYRCRDIAVIERTNGTYKQRVIDALKRLDVPVFDDSRRSLSFETLFVYVNAVLSCVSSGFTTESIFNYLKTGFGELSLTEVSELEKYTLIWGINGKSWLSDFTMHPDGFGTEFNDDSKRRLYILNEYRKKTVLPLLNLKNQLVDKDGKGISETIYNFLISQKIPEKLFELYENINNDGFPVEAQRHSVSWDILIDILNTMAVMGEDKYFGIERWVELFRILVDSKDIGEIPQGLDEVRVGSADRIRLDQMKIVFLVGVNKNEFPLVNVKSGILTDSDRVSLTSIGLEVRPPFEDSVDEERFIAYCAVTAASEKLILTYKTNGDDGSTAVKSEIIETAINSINNPGILVFSESNPIEFIESDDTAFTMLCQKFYENSSFKSTLLEYFKEKDEYVGKLRSLENINCKTSVSFADKNISERLFGKNIYLSASRVEHFYSCPFSYFMRYGLKAEPLRAAELDPAQSGTIVHLVMETVLKAFPSDGFVNATDDELRETVSRVLTEYLEEKMGGFQEKSKRFLFLFQRLVDVSMAIIGRLKTEFNVGSFVPADFELKIGGDDIAAYKLPLDDSEVTITGSVDRVDIMEKDGIKYLRVVDYKTGKKEFKLSELFDGLNIQMVLYLMALEKNGKDYYGDIVPAGVLYLPSRIGVADYLDRRSPTPENIAAQKRVSGKLSGMVLNSPVVFNGMGVDKVPDYFPVGYKKDGSAKGDYYSLQNFKNLSDLIDGKIINMAESLHCGKIAPVPSGKNGEGKMCKYCSYKPVCGHEYGDKIAEITSLTHSKALANLEEGNDEQTVD